MSGITVIPGSANLAPLYIPDNQEAPAWCHLPAEELGEAERSAIAEFCRQQAWESGWDDVLAGSVQADTRNPFHLEFLGGAPISGR